MVKKYYIVSDIHGHYNEMTKSLALSGYNENNESNHLIVLGDMFDRGTQSKEVLEYMYKLYVQKKVDIILGNHESFLIEFLDGNYIKALFNMKYNGFKKTLESFVGRKLTIEENWDKINWEIRKKYPYLYKFLERLPLYIETNKYIFVHGGISYGETNWKENSKRDFIWGKESEFESVPGKTVVCGHERVSKIRYPSEDQVRLCKNNPKAFNILKSKGKIHIDAYVEVSKKINVLTLVLKDEDFK